MLAARQSRFRGILGGDTVSGHEKRDPWVAFFCGLIDRPEVQR